jgi:hypothetical protein
MDGFKLSELHIFQLKLNAVKQQEQKNFEVYDHFWEYTYCTSLGGLYNEWIFNKVNIKVIILP